MKIIGIDPGASGAIIVMDMDTGKIIEAIKMPETATDVYDFLVQYNIESYCFLEKIHGMPGMSGTSMFSFGQGYGHLEMALIALKIPTESVTPQKWQKEFQVGTKSSSASKTEWKNKLKAKAQSMFPNIKVTLALADALLITEYGRRVKK
jgi:hypothetical protein